MQAMTEEGPKKYVLVYDQLSEPFPNELGRAMARWTGDAARGMDRVYCVVEIDGDRKLAHYTATDGHRLIRVVCETEAGPGYYVYDPGEHELVQPSFDSIIPKPWIEVGGTRSFLNFRASEPSGKWSFNIAYIAELREIEKALRLVHTRVTMPRGRETKWAKKARVAANMRAGLINFELAGELDPMIATTQCCGCDVTAYIMPRKI